jgi:hypothetical protein
MPIARRKENIMQATERNENVIVAKLFAVSREHVLGVAITRKKQESDLDGMIASPFYVMYSNLYTTD